MIISNPYLFIYFWGLGGWGTLRQEIFSISYLILVDGSRVIHIPEQWFTDCFVHDHFVCLLYKVPE